MALAGSTRFIRTIACVLIASGLAAAAQATKHAPGPAEATKTPVTIQVDLSRNLGAFGPVTNWFGFDESNYASMPGGQELLRELYAMSATPIYIRSHHLLTSGNGVPELKWSSSNVFRLGPDGKPVYDFTITDRTFDAYKRAGVRPFVELGFMPEDLAAAVPGITKYQLHYPKPTMGGSVNNPPRNYRMWRNLIHAYVAHLVARYGAEEVRQWYFEVWNEPDIIYWHGTQQEYFKLYDYAADGVTSALPGARVGGPATTGPASPKAAAYLRAFLDHCMRDRSAANGGRVPLDFISYHPKGRTQMVNGHAEMGLAEELRSVDAGFRIVASYPRFRNLPIILSEADPEGCAACSARLHPANMYRDTPQYASYTAAAFKAMLDLAARQRVNLCGMVTWAFEFPDAALYEGFRSLSTRGIDKPILNLFRMVGLMRGNRVWAESSGHVPLKQIVSGHIDSDIDALATLSTHSAAVLQWNYGDSGESGPPASVETTLSGLPAGVTRVLLERYRIDATHSNSYTAWKRMGAPSAPTAEQYAELKAAGQLQDLASPEWVDVHDRRVVISSDLPRQAVGLLRITW